MTLIEPTAADATELGTHYEPAAWRVAAVDECQDALLAVEREAAELHAEVDFEGKGEAHGSFFLACGFSGVASSASGCSVMSITSGSTEMRKGLSE